MIVAVVGACASGKSTVVSQLKQRGYDAYVVGQEHSQIRNLWNRRQPDALVFLDVKLETVRHRRGPTWPAWIFSTQQERLADARAHASVVVENDVASIEHVLDQIVAALSSGADEQT